MRKVSCYNILTPVVCCHGQKNWSLEKKLGRFDSTKYKKIVQQTLGALYKNHTHYDNHTALKGTWLEMAPFLMAFSAWQEKTKCRDLVQLNIPSQKLTARPLKLDGWKMILSFWGPAQFQGLLLLVSGSVHSGKVTWLENPPR